jgi:hypothetical protein
MGNANSDDPPATPPALPPVWKHPLYYPDFAWKVCIAIAAAVWAVSSFYQKNANDERLLNRQIQNQNRVADSQKELAEEQLAAGLLPRFKCDASTLKTLDFFFLESVSFKQAINISNAVAKCTQNPKGRIEATQNSVQNQLNELDQQFLSQLSIARQYRSVGLQNQAALEYSKAYDELPQARRNSLDESIALKARQALENRDFPAASDLFEQFFGPIGTP